MGGRQSRYARAKKASGLVIPKDASAGEHRTMQRCLSNNSFGARARSGALGPTVAADMSPDSVTPSGRRTPQGDGPEGYVASPSFATPASTKLLERGGKLEGNTDKAQLWLGAFDRSRHPGATSNAIGTRAAWAARVPTDNPFRTGRDLKRTRDGST